MTSTLRELGDRRQPLWLGLDALLVFRRMPDFSTALAQGFLTCREPKVRIFISHPWETAEMPDPDGGQWAVIRAAMRDFMTPYDPPALRDGGLGVYARWQPPAAERYVMRVEARFGNNPLHSPAIQHLYRARNSLSPDALQYFGKSAHTPKETRAFRDDIGLWIDYSCLPQGVRSPDEEYFFERILAKNNYLATTSIVVAIWPDPTSQIKRAWCLSEAALNQGAAGRGAVTPAWKQAGADAIGSLEMKNQLAFAPPSAFVNEAISAVLEATRRTKSWAELREWLTAHGIKTRVDSDLDLVVASLFASAVAVHRLGVKAVFLKALSGLAEGLWWAVAFPFLAAYPIAAAARRVVDRGEGDQRKRGLAGRIRAQVVTFVMLLVFGTLNMLPAAVLVVLAPIEGLRRVAGAGLERCRAEYIARIARGSAAD